MTYEECDARWGRINPATYGTDLDINENTNSFGGSRKRQPDVNMDQDTIRAIAVIANQFANSGPDKGKVKANKRQKRAHSQGGPWCKHFNHREYPNEKTDMGCVGPDKVHYVHSCSVRVPPGNRKCGKADHNALTHP